PADIAESNEKDPIRIACAIAAKLHLRGLLELDMFQDRDGKLVVNEIAPQPHNSGHWSLEGCRTSQFEQQVRAVCGLTLGSTELLRPSAMANLLGDIWQLGEPDWLAALAFPNVHLHLYGKHEARPRRKMGHLTALASSAEEAAKLVGQARESLCKQKL